MKAWVKYCRIVFLNTKWFKWSLLVDYVLGKWENEKYEWNNTGKLFLIQNLWRNRFGVKHRTQDNSPHIKLTLRQLAPDSETNLPHVVILHYVLKYAGKIINVLKLSVLLIDLNTHWLLIPGLIICPRFPLKIIHSYIKTYCLHFCWR